MIACDRPDDDDGSGGAEQYFRPLPQQLQTWTAAESSGCGNGCVEQARQADRSVLMHGLCAVTIALATARVLPASAFTAITALAVCLVGLRVLSPVLRTPSCSLFRFSGRPCGRRSAEANVIIDHGGRSVPPATTTSGLRLLMRVMRGVQRWGIFIRPKRSRRSTRRCHDTASRSVTTITSAETVETVTSSPDYVHRSQRQYQLVRTSREQR